ncbi:NINE protein [Chamaesiphon minutus]|uniref:Putative membrane protein n=1 Tax=Chamaesiphon minutus (strain ATCC 27169 / PCC 6605) TaxID=1173020 RepID=K9UL66_CHAP6|nr:NINE protein [Chamaesiphon minutus]AFY95822.1 putative membrane protein [Chamaesiphon minutus PCC 6605]
MRNRTAAILICFFGGYFGIHKFYLGQTFQGVLYLLFCWAGIPAIFAFFDFFVLCFMPDREFDARFNYAAPNTLDRGMSYPVAPASKSSKEATSTLYELKKLYEDGIITAEEYEVKRRKMLDDI